MSDPSTVLYQMGASVGSAIDTHITDLLAANNSWTGTNTFLNNVEVGNVTTARAFKTYGTIESTGDLTVGGNTEITGNLTVLGTTTALSTTEMEVKDNFIHLSKGASAGAYAKDSGFYFERGSGSDAQAFIWDESEGEFVLGGLESVGSTKTITFSGVSAQIGTAGSSNTIDVSVSAALSFQSPQSSGGTVTTPEKFYVFAGSGDNKTIEINGVPDNTYTYFSGQYGYFIFTQMDNNNGQMLPNYAVILIGESGVALSNYDIADIKILDAGSGAISNPGFSEFSVTYSDGTSVVASDSTPVSFSTGAYPLTAGATNSGQVTYTAGTYDVTMVLKGQLASDITEVQISGTNSGSPVVDWQGNPAPFAYNSGTLSYIADSASPYTTFQQLAVDASKLAYSSSNTSTNGGYYIASSTDGLLLEVSFNATPGSLDYIGLAHGSSVVMPVPASFAASGPGDDTATVTPGPLRVGSITITDQTDGEVALGDLTDFEAGLAS